MSGKLRETTAMLLKMEEANDEQVIEIAKLQMLITKLQKQLAEKNQVIEDNRHSFEIQLQDHKTEVNEVY